MTPDSPHSDNKRDSDLGSVKSSSHSETGFGDHDAEFERRTIRKVDARLLPILGALYAFALIDRGNLAIARVAGAGASLGLNIGARYSIASLVLFIPYILLELPSNLILRWVGPKIWLTFISLSWGAVQIGMGFVKNWHGLVACRALLGVLEAGFFPACFYLISTWYIRREVQTRLAAFYLMSVLVGGFANVMAYGFTLMEGTAGLHGWRWIFIMCGVITCGIGLFAYPLIVDFPDQNKFLTPEQTAFIQERIQRDRGDAEPDPLTWSKAAIYARDIKIWVFAFLYMFTTMPAYAFGYFLPIILGGMGYNVRDSQLLCAPPYVTAVVSAFCFAFAADKLGRRAPFIAAQAIITIIGLSMTAFAERHSVRYAGVFFGLAGCQGNIPAILAYNANNIVGQSKRSFSSALVVGFGGIGGIIATTVFRQQDSPKYLPGLWTTIGFQLATLVVLAVTSVWFASENKKTRENPERLIEGQRGFYYTL